MRNKCLTKTKYTLILSENTAIMGQEDIKKKHCLQLPFQNRFFVKSITETGLKTIEVYTEDRNDLPFTRFAKEVSREKKEADNDKNSNLSE